MNGLAGAAIGTAVVGLTLIVSVIMAYVFKAELMNMSSVNLSYENELNETVYTEAGEQVNQIFGYVTTAFGILGLGLLIMAFTFAVRIMRGMGQ